MALGTGASENGDMPPMRLEFEELTGWLGALRTPVVTSWVLRGPDGVVLVDANLAGQHDAILGALAEWLGVRYDAVPLRQIVLTHAHPDHYGSANELAGRTGAKLLGPAEEADVFSGRSQLPAPPLSDWEKSIFERVVPDVLPAPPLVLDHHLRAGHRLEGYLGAELVAAPGHTPGQLVVWVPQHRTLLAADALATREGRASPGAFNVDPDEAATTAARLLEELRPVRVCVAHGQPVSGDPVGFTSRTSRETP